MHCQCGCGGKANAGKMYITGHNMRGKKNPCSLEKRRHLHKIMCKVMNLPEIQVKLHKPKRDASKMVQGRKNLEEWHNILRGKSVEQAYGKKIANRMKARQLVKKLGRKRGRHTPETVEKIRRARFDQKIITKNTLPERIVAKMLRQGGIKFRPQYNIKYKVIVDFYLPEQNIAIFVDGDFWHCHPRMGYKNNEIVHHGLTKQEIVEKDRRQTKYVESIGMRVVRVWECDLKAGKVALQDLTAKETG